MKLSIGLTTKQSLFERARQILFENFLRRPKKYSISFQQKRFVQYPDVFPADVFEDAKFFTPHLEVKKGEEFLEMGVGSGVTAVTIAAKGVRVTGVDINPSAVTNAQENAAKHGVETNTEFFVSDLFEGLTKRKFDTIYWNIPFCCATKRSTNLLERSIYDYKYRSLKAFFRSAKNYLKPGGQIYIGFSNTIGDFDKLAEFVKKGGFSTMSVVAQKEFTWKDIETDLTLYCIT